MREERVLDAEPRGALGRRGLGLVLPARLREAVGAALGAVARRARAAAQRGVAFRGGDHVRKVGPQQPGQGPPAGRQRARVDEGDVEAPERRLRRARARRGRVEVAREDLRGCYIFNPTST